MSHSTGNTNRFFLDALFVMARARINPKANVVIEQPLASREVTGDRQWEVEPFESLLRNHSALVQLNGRTNGKDVESGQSEDNEPPTQHPLSQGGCQRFEVGRPC